MRYDLTVDEFVELIRPEVEAGIDAWIADHPPEDRHILMRVRERMIDKALDLNKLANLQYRLAEAEARLRPRLVE